MTEPTTEAGRAWVLAEAADRDGDPDYARETALAIEAEAVEPWRAALRELTEAAHGIYGMNEYDAPMVKARALLADKPVGAGTRHWPEDTEPQTYNHAVGQAERHG